MNALLAYDNAEKRFRDVFGGKRGRSRRLSGGPCMDDHDIFTRRVRMGWSDLYWRDTDHPQWPFLWVVRDREIIYTSTHKDWSDDSAGQISSLGRVLWTSEHNSDLYGTEGSVYHEHSRCHPRSGVRCP